MLSLHPYEQGLKTMGNQIGRHSWKRSSQFIARCYSFIQTVAPLPQCITMPETIKIIPSPEQEYEQP